MSTLRRLFAELPCEIKIVLAPLAVAAVIALVVILVQLTTAPILFEYGITLENAAYYWERRFGIAVLVLWFLAWVYIPVVRHLTNLFLVAIVFTVLSGGRFGRRW